jgi:hypothetical protein
MTAKIVKDPTLQAKTTAALDKKRFFKKTDATYLM